MRDASPLRTMTVDEYFRFEEDSPIKHEYVAGEVYAVSGVTARHNLIAGTVFGQLLAAEVNTGCRVFMSDMRLEVADDKYYYPDVLVVCTRVAESDIVTREPCVVVEVTSPSTARTDRSEKVDASRKLRSLRTYLIIDHRRRRVERHWRDVSGDWMRAEIVGDDETPIAIPCLDVHLSLDVIYRRVALPAVGEPDAGEYEATEF